MSSKYLLAQNGLLSRRNRLPSGDRHNEEAPDAFFVPAILGVAGDEVIHSLLDVMYAKAPYATIRRAMHIHPTVSELVPTLLQDLQPLES